MIGLDYISGERAMFASTLAPHLHAVAALHGFGLEVFLNQLWLQDHCRIAAVPLAGVVSPSKVAKQGWLRGVANDVKMMRDIFHTVGFATVYRQIAGLMAARVNQRKGAGVLAGIARRAGLGADRAP